MSSMERIEASGSTRSFQSLIEHYVFMINTYYSTIYYTQSVELVSIESIEGSQDTKNITL